MTQPLHDEKAITTLHKLHALWHDVRTPHHERELAYEQICRRLDKYGLTWDIFEETITKEYGFPFRTKDDLEILAQCYFKVCQTGELIWITIGKKRQRFLELTAREYADLDTLYAFYRALWNEERTKLLNSFFGTHDLYGPEVTTATLNSEKWLEEQARQNAFAEANDPLATRQLTEGEK